jgi:hypothetical protein
MSERRNAMRGSHVLLAALAAAVTLTSVAAGGPAATKQRVKERYPDVSFPVWSPDGRRIAFLAWRPTASSWNASQEGWFSSLFEIRVVSADGSDQRVLARGAGSPAWSPDGRRIAFDRDRDIYVVNADGSGQRRLTTITPDARSSFYNPVWSPDGQRIALTGWREGETGTNPRIYVVGADGGELRMLTRRGSQPAWSPDGQKLLFVSDRDGLDAVFVMNADGSGQRRLTSPGPAIPMPVRCGFSHRNQDDPIVSPGQPGRSHDHTFFGNRSTDAFATPTALRKDKRTTCSDPADTSAYWVPTLYVAGRAVEPLALIATYGRRTSRPLEPFSAGLKMVAGNANAHRAQSSRATFWSCAVPRAERSSTIPRCPGTRRGGLRLHVGFPDCWDGTRLDSADHKSHMAYSSHAACPRSHPVAVPALSLVVHYPVPGGRTAELASGGQFTGHADFLNAWNQAELASRVKRYLNRTRE